MATPSVLTTTVSGKFCTRSRRSISTTTTTTTNLVSTTIDAVTSAISSAAVSSTDAQLQSSAPPAQQTSLAVQDPQAAQTTAADAQPASSAAAAAPVLSSSPLSAAPVLSQNPGTVSSVSLTVSQLAPSSQSLLPLQGPIVTPVAFISDSGGQSALFAASSSTDSSAPTASDSVQSVLVPTTPPSSSTRLPGRPQPTSFSTGGSGGIISPIQGSGSDSRGHISSNAQQVNVGGVVGGVVGGLMGMAVVGAVLFLCFRRRRTRETLAGWRKRINEKRHPEETAGEERSEPASLSSQAKAFVAGIGPMATAMMSKIRIRPNKDFAQESRNRSADRNSVTSVYSTRSSVRLRSSSEPPSKFRRQLHGFADRIATVKWPKGRPGRRQNSTGISPFSGVVDDPLVRSSSRISNPFLDPELLREPTLPNLRIMNPDASRPTTGTATPRQAVAEGLAGQQRAPLTPRTPRLPQRSQQAGRIPQIPNPFSDPEDEPEDRTGSATPDWLRRSSHARTQSAQTALRSHPPSSFYTASIYQYSPTNPFMDPPDFPVPPLPTQPATTYAPQGPFSAYLPITTAANSNNNNSNNN
ncbi:hypothetical protein AOQ84DRAFT_390914, partial [Glonium stellatum]